MTIKSLVVPARESVEPFASVESVMNKLLEAEHLVVKENGKFLGILTFPDVVRKSHTLVIDCLVPKEPASDEDDVQSVYDRMRRENERVLPVFDKEKRFAGCVTLEDVIRETYSLNAAPVEVKVENVIADERTEGRKHDFLRELYHNTKNPIQVIYSALGMMEGPASPKDRELLLKNIHTNTKKIDDVINGLYSKYFFPS